VLAVVHVGGEFRAGYCILGYIRVISIHLGYFGARGGVGGSEKSARECVSEVRIPN
jgi:hypothetical protein